MDMDEFATPGGASYTLSCVTATAVVAFSSRPESFVIPPPPV